MNRSDKEKMLSNAKDRLASAWKDEKDFGEMYSRLGNYLRSGEDAEIVDHEVESARKAMTVMQGKARKIAERIALQVETMEKDLGVYDDSLDFLKDA